MCQLCSSSSHVPNPNPQMHRKEDDDDDGEEYDGTMCDRKQRPLNYQIKKHRLVFRVKRTVYALNLIYSVPIPSPHSQELRRKEKKLVCR